MKNKLDMLKNENPIFEIQYYLREIAQAKKEIPEVIPTGVYDKQTKNAVIEYQKINALPTTGKVDYKTWNNIVEQYKKVSPKINKPNKLTCFPSKVTELKIEDECDTIYAVQIMLKNFNKKYKNYPKVGVSGRYDLDTENAIKYFQKLSNLPPTGKIDIETWNTITTIYDICKMYD